MAVDTTTSAAFHGRYWPGNVRDGRFRPRADMDRSRRVVRLRLHCLDLTICSEGGFVIRDDISSSANERMGARINASPRGRECRAVGPGNDSPSLQKECTRRGALAATL